MAVEVSWGVDVDVGCVVGEWRWRGPKGLSEGGEGREDGKGRDDDW